jgi:hypothetical protein
MTEALSATEREEVAEATASYEDWRVRIEDVTGRHRYNMDLAIWRDGRWADRVYRKVRLAKDDVYAIPAFGWADELPADSARYEAEDQDREWRLRIVGVLFSRHIEIEITSDDGHRFSREITLP